jgi:hypothetical protein
MEARKDHSHSLKFLIKVTDKETHETLHAWINKIEVVRYFAISDPQFNFPLFVEYLKGAVREGRYRVFYMSHVRMLVIDGMHGAYAVPVTPKKPLNVIKT